MPIGDVLKHRVICYVGSTTQQLGINVRHWTIGSITGGEPTHQQICDYLDGLAAPLYKAVMGNTALYRGSGIQLIFPGIPKVEVFTVANTGNGAMGAELCPPQSTGLITLNANFASRGNRGRVYTPFPSEDSQDTGTFVAGMNAKMLAIKDFWVITKTVTVGGASLTLTSTLWHRAIPAGKPGGPRAAFGSPIISGFAHTTIATQRRRGLYGKQNILPF